MRKRIDFCQISPKEDVSKVQPTEPASPLRSFMGSPTQSFALASPCLGKQHTELPLSIRGPGK